MVYWGKSVFNPLNSVIPQKIGYNPGFPTDNLRKWLIVFSTLAAKPANSRVMMKLVLAGFPASRVQSWNVQKCNAIF